MSCVCGCDRLCGYETTLKSLGFIMEDLRRVNTYYNEQRARIDPRDHLL